MHQRVSRAITVIIALCLASQATVAAEPIPAHLSTMRIVGPSGRRVFVDIALYNESSRGEVALRNSGPIMLRGSTPQELSLRVAGKQGLHISVYVPVQEPVTVQLFAAGQPIASQTSRQAGTVLEFVYGRDTNGDSSTGDDPAQRYAPTERQRGVIAAFQAALETDDDQRLLDVESPKCRATTHPLLKLVVSRLRELGEIRVDSGEPWTLSDQVLEGSVLAGSIRVPVKLALDADGRLDMLALIRPTPDFSWDDENVLAKLLGDESRNFLRYLQAGDVTAARRFVGSSRTLAPATLEKIVSQLRQDGFRLEQAGYKGTFEGKPGTVTRRLGTAFEFEVNGMKRYVAVFWSVSRPSPGVPWVPLGADLVNCAVVPDLSMFTTPLPHDASK